MSRQESAETVCDWLANLLKQDCSPDILGRALRDTGTRLIADWANAEIGGNVSHVSSFKGDMIVNGSLKGFDEYSLSKDARFTDAEKFTGVASRGIEVEFGIPRPIEAGNHGRRKKSEGGMPFLKCGSGE